MSSVENDQRATEEIFREVANLLYGGGADELVSRIAKRSDHSEAKEKATYRAAMTGNTIAAVGGAHALGMSLKELKNSGKPPSPPGRHMKEVKSKLPGAEKVGGFIRRHPKASVGIAAGWTGLHGVELLSDVQGRKAMKAQYKQKQENFGKSEPCQSDLHVGGSKQYRLARGAIKALNESPRVNSVKVEAGEKVKAKVKDAGLKVKQTIGKSFTFEGEFSKVDEDKRQVFGWASIVEMGGQPVYDLQGDFIEMDEIEKSAYDYVIKSRKGGDMHRRNPDNTPVHSSDMIESFMVTPEKISKMGLPEGSLPTGWWVGFQVNDDDAWNLVKSGKRTAFSIHGRGNRTPLET